MVALLDEVTQKNVNAWLDGNYDEKSKEQIRLLLKSNQKELADAFYTTLSFGTAGMRGIMGVGSNRMNVYTVRCATQGLANAIKHFGHPSQSVFIGYDCRHNSRLFAEEAAKVLAANGLSVHICQELRPTPFVSFGCRALGCSAAIMITASHNPPQYNGYKVYWSDGGQVVPPYDQAITEEIEKIVDIAGVSVLTDLNSPFIHWVGPELDERYLEAIGTLQLYPEENRRYGRELKVIYSSLHGTGITLIPTALERQGFTACEVVAEQAVPDGDFPTAPKPNPEEEAALALGIALLEKREADLLIATDPDADRIGVALRHNGAVHHLSGNQLAALCLEHVCKGLERSGRASQESTFVKSIGTTELFAKVAASHGFPCINTLTGFKYIAELIHRWEDASSATGHKFIFGAEESCGYLLGSIVRDKDAVSTSALVCEMALQAKWAGKTLIDLLHALWWRHGVFFETVLSVAFEESKAGRERMSHATAGLRTAPPALIAGVAVVAVEDYLAQTSRNILSGEITPLSLPQADGLLLWLADDTKILVRPSGTEPKVKLYIGVKEAASGDITAAEHAAKEKGRRIQQAIQELLITQSEYRIRI